MAEKEFAGKTALVTGGSRGIGRATCVALAREGANVAINFAANPDAAGETRAAVEAEGVKAITVQADVSDPDQVAAMVATVEQGLGPVDLLVANAGIGTANTHDALDFAKWRRTMDVNVDGVFHSIMAVKDGMLARKYGRIVCIASIAGLFARPFLLDYAVSKAAVIAIARNFGPALAPHVRVNAVAPGLTDTEMVSGLDSEQLNAMVDITPMKRMGRTDEIAQMILFQLSDRSSFTTGQTMVADGGRVTLP
jgi:3-oxoacyl-[acyl-carrier protein] reductase